MEMREKRVFRRELIEMVTDLFVYIVTISPSSRLFATLSTSFASGDMLKATTASSQKALLLLTDPHQCYLEKGSSRRKALDRSELFKHNSHENVRHCSRCC